MLVCNERRKGIAFIWRHHRETQEGAFGHPVPHERILSATVRPMLEEHLNASSGLPVQAPR